MKIRTEIQFRVGLLPDSFIVLHNKQTLCRLATTNWTGSRYEHYQDLLHAVLCDGIVHPAEKRLLREFRTEHKLTPQQHAQALESCEWTAHEFDDGARAADMTKEIAGQHARVRRLQNHMAVRTRISRTVSPNTEQ